MVTYPKTRDEAKQLGTVSYFTGLLCANGHIAKRYTNTGICYACKKENIKKDYQRHRKRYTASNERSRKKNWDKVKITQKNWCAKNRDRSNEIKQNWKLRNIEIYKANARAYVKRKRLDPIWRLSHNTSKGIWDSLKNKKGGRHWETLVDFALDELKAHLESQFKDGMTWDNYCTFWEVDHIKPVSLCKTFEEAWKLNNLQPLECSKNRSKCNRFIG